jgi:ketosteroid isomerase-like protein
VAGTSSVPSYEPAEIYSAGFFNMTGTNADDTRVDLWFWQTLGLVKREGRWLLAHQHAFRPFAMDSSGKAMLDLRP